MINLEYSNSSLICFTNVFELCYLVFKSLIVLFKFLMIASSLVLIACFWMKLSLFKSITSFSKSSFFNWSLLMIWRLLLLVRSYSLDLDISSSCKDWFISSVFLSLPLISTNSSNWIWSLFSASAFKFLHLNYLVLRDLKSLNKPERSPLSYSFA